MWKLSKLEIRGFKSFADAAELDFPEGITAVVGPNGCGKSNISDAILWVLGEQSTRALRAHQMQDIIFQGTATRRAIGLAEVTLYLSNGASNGQGGFDSLADLEARGATGLRPEADGDGRLVAALEPATGNGSNGSGGNGANGNGARRSDRSEDSSTRDRIPPVKIDAPGGSIEIESNEDSEADDFGDSDDPSLLKITRRLFRSGDSEYLLDGDKCRLRDIRERLTGTGLGTRTCFQIGQGKIDQILSASSLERRAPLEEAAGIALYRHRRHLTQLKLEATAQDVARIDDIYEEVGRQMRSLKRQAGRARRYKKLRGELRRLERAWLYRELLESQQRESLAVAVVGEASEAEKKARENLTAAAMKLEHERKRMRVARKDEQDRRQRLYQNQLEQERLRAEVQRQEDRQRFAEERQAELERRSTELKKRLEEAKGLRVRRKEVAQQSEAVHETAKAVLSEAEEELAAARRRLDLALRPAPSASEDGEGAQPLSVNIIVEEEDFPALSLALGDLLDVKVLPDAMLGEWLGETLDDNRRSRALRCVESPIIAPPPADDRIAGALQERISGRNETVEAVVGSLLQDTWLITNAEDAPELARSYPGHAFVDNSGSCWACGAEVRVRGRQARLRMMEVAEDAAGAETEQGFPAELEVTSPEELGARENRDRAAIAAVAAGAQADASRQELAVSEAACRRLKSEHQRTLSEVKSLIEASKTATKRAEKATKQADDAVKKGAFLEANVNAADIDDKAGEAEVAALQEAQSLVRNDLERAQEARSKLEVEAAEIRVAGQHIEEQIREKLAIGPAELLKEGPLEVVEGTEGPEEPKRGKKDEDTDIEKLAASELRGLSREIQGKIERLGPVNLVAYEDFEVQEGRHQELGVQRKDLKDAAANLNDAIGRIDTDCIERFNDCFESINGYFNRIFRQLFGGGKAGMKLENPEDPLNSGIEIFAQPPGKKLQNIRLLSGGERTLVALSLLFGIFEYRPAAFCILDEADAALDEPNIERFLRALHSFESHTQFILITHNKRTMEIADLLYGVTMQESGVSQLVSVQLH